MWRWSTGGWRTAPKAALLSLIKRQEEELRKLNSDLFAIRIELKSINHSILQKEDEKLKIVFAGQYSWQCTESQTTLDCAPFLDLCQFVNKNSIQPLSVHGLCETTLIFDFWILIFLHVWPWPDEREAVLKKFKLPPPVWGPSMTWIVFSVKTPSPLKSSILLKHRSINKSKMNRIGRRQIVLFLLASLSALLTLTNREETSGSVRPPAARRGGRAIFFLQPTEKFAWCGKNFHSERGQNC